MNAPDRSLDPSNLTTRRNVGHAVVQVFDSRAAMADAAADAIANQIRRVARAKNIVRMIFAAAPSQSDMLATLTAMPDIAWNNVEAFHMDDYLELPADAPQRFANWLDDHVFSKVPIGSVHHIPNGGDPGKNCRSYAAKLAEAPIDIVCLGIGVNGHIAFNDPPVADFEDPEAVKVVEIDDICRQQQVDDKCFSDIEQVPHRAITLTIPRLLAADALFCVVSGAHKREAVRQALDGPVTAACPASILRTHPDCTVFLDPEASSHGR